MGKYRLKPPLTVKRLKEFVAKCEAAPHIGSIDEWPIHIMVMDTEDAVDDSRARFATNVDLDMFDDEGGRCVSVTVWNEEVKE